MPEVHSLLSPSASHRWMTCPASIRMSRNIPSKTSIYAVEGTAVHKLIENSIKGTKPAQSSLGKKILKVTITQQMIDNAEKFLEYFQSHRSENGIAESELWVDLKFLGIAGLDGGTADGVLVSDTNITVMDYKNGSGVKVDSYMNTQLLCYAVGLINLFPNRKTVTLVIIQPNVCDEPIEWTVPVDEVLCWCKFVLIPKARACLDPASVCCPSESACKFCPCAGFCKAYYEKVNMCAQVEFSQEEEATLPAVESLSTEQKEKIVYYADLMRNFLLAVEGNVKDDMLRGSHDYPLLKLVRKNTRRKLKEDALDDVTSPLWDVLSEDEVYTRKPRALSDLEKAIKKASDKETAKKVLDAITEKPEGEIIVVSFEDKRKAVEPVTSEFNQIGD